jgi:hypothetical protein
MNPEMSSTKGYIIYLLEYFFLLEMLLSEKFYLQFTHYCQHYNLPIEAGFENPQRANVAMACDLQIYDHHCILILISLLNFTN